MKIVSDEVKEPNYGWTPESFDATKTLQEKDILPEATKTSLSIPEPEYKDHIYLPSRPESSFTSFKVNPEALDAKEARCFSLVISLHDATILHASNSIIDALGYPKDMLHGRCLLNYLYPRDKPTFSNYLSQALQSRFATITSSQPKNDKFTFYIRFREYMSLRKGFGIATRKPTFKPFQLICHTRDVLVNGGLCSDRKLSTTNRENLNHKTKSKNDNTHENGNPSAQIENENNKDEEFCDMFQTVCLVVNAVSIESVYQVPNEVSPAMTPFTTRHTASCHFSYIDSNTISYLGYLPQDLIGNSVFVFCKHEDFGTLREVYETLTSESSLSFCSNRHSFKAFNGDYVMLETDWSSYINPYSKKIEFVVGEHRVLRGPSNPDVFKETQLTCDKGGRHSQDVSEEITRFQEEIKLLLREPIKKKNCMTEQDMKRKRKLAKFVSNIIDGIGNGVESFESGTPIELQCSCSDLDSPVVGELSSYKRSFELKVSYHEKCFLDNIERFFNSNPKSNCPPSESNASPQSNLESSSSPREHSGTESNESSETTSNMRSNGYESTSTGQKKGSESSMSEIPLIRNSKGKISTLPLTKEVLHWHEKVSMKEFLESLESNSLQAQESSKLKRTYTPDTTTKHMKKHQKIQKDEKGKQLKEISTTNQEQHLTISINPPFSIASLIIPISHTQANSQMCSSCCAGANQLVMPIIPHCLSTDIAPGSETLISKVVEKSDEPISTNVMKKSVEVQTDTILKESKNVNDDRMCSSESSSNNQMNIGSSDGSANEMVISSGSDTDVLKKSKNFVENKYESRNNEIESLEISKQSILSTDGEALSALPQNI
ncbi:period circadian protein-like protein [Dinothrombium tinctorium]|uniref:Period circadian protein n=1 Tax=Dinothrombium tinctorium TaxID=1965070 RepID=A0A3S3PC81_9ACAR|nr:period circadian protein-like protein [Dinothrombium tinctorium]RWS16599.1 period circadian protein-like protein [Dinothrombium tinctorium]